MKKKVIIIGGGFAGLACLFRLARHNKILDITLIDKAGEFNFLPLLPDTLGRGIHPGHLTCSLENITSKLGVRFLCAAVGAVDLEKKQITAGAAALDYDYLVIACGSETNFYGNEQIRKNAFKLDDARDAMQIRAGLADDKFDGYVVSGGGYTGIEVATNLRLYLQKKAKNKRVVIVERAPSILGPLPEWIKAYVADNLRALGIECFTNTVIERVEGRTIYLQGAGQLDNVMLIWAAGVRTADFIQNLKVEKNPQGRIKVDAYLRLDEHCYVVGDAACVLYENTFLRMAVQFAIMQVRCAARNIMRNIQGRKPLKYKPQDLGYIIPMANNRACGKIFGMDMRGWLPIFLHYCMCIYRSCGMRNRWGIIKDLIGGGER
jgi:NADH dehydrogenase